MTRRISLLLLVLVVAAGFGSTVSQAAELELRDGDRVVFLGDALMEQEQYFGWIEVMLTTAFPDRDVSFRNLGWSADTPAGASRLGLSLMRAGTEPEGEGWRQLTGQLELTKPNVVVLGYGMASSIESGSEGLPAFVDDYRRLIEAIRDISPDARLLFLSPIGRLDDQHPHQQVLKEYAAAIRSLAGESDAPFVDLLDVAGSEEARKDPIHLNDRGYRTAAVAIQQQLNLPDSGWQKNAQTEALRDVILRKNEWWFHRSRPANMAYVFGFRKHEQGQNAGEIPRFDELIEEEESRIAKLRGLLPYSLQQPAPRLESKYAEFTPQPTPQFTIADNWEVTLWAENPQLNKPIHMNFDPQGRLWVASSEAYPMIEVGQASPDKIIVLQDTNGDGTADSSNVFADGLLIPTGVAPGDGGVYVAQSTDLLFLKDTDGDGKADLKRRVLNGFGTEDTHHNLHTLQFGPDGRLYMNQSVYTRTHAETPHDVVRLLAGGGFRYHTGTMRMEIFFRGLWNSWGHQTDAFGQSFLTDGAGFAGVAYAFPGAIFNPTPGARRQFDLISPGNYPKFASLEVVYGDAYPPSWQGSIVTCDFRANRVTRFSLKEQGAGFVTEQEDDLLRTSASTFRPIDVKQGPDGALYIADWSNPIINHGEVDFRDPRRDRWHGRIWRVAWKGGTAEPASDLTQLETVPLLDQLVGDDRYRRDQARRVLIERGDVVLDTLQSWLQQQSDARAALEALWLYQAFNRVNEPLLDRVLQSDDGRIRAAAARVLGDWTKRDNDVDQPIAREEALVRLRQLIGDGHPRVRLEAVRALAHVETAEAGFVALAALDQPMDRFLNDALWLTVNELDQELMTALEQGDASIATQNASKQLEFVLTAVEPRLASDFLTRYLRSNPLAADGSGPWIELIGKAGGPEELKRIYRQALAGDFDQAATRRVLVTLTEAQRFRKVRPAGGPAGLEKLIEHDDPGVRQAAIRLASTWKVGGQVPRLADLARNSAIDAATRRAATEALSQIANPTAKSALAELAHNAESIPLRSAAVLGLAAIDFEAARKPFFELLGETDSEEAALTLWRGMLGRQGAGKQLATALPESGISEASALLALQVAREGGREEPELIAALAPLAGKAMSSETMTPQQMTEMASRVVANGDPYRGEAIYRREALACMTCHAIGGVGGKVGPDLTSLGASAPVDYLVESIFNPNAKIKEGYHSVVVATADGQLVTGIEVESTDAELVLRNAQDEVIRIAQDDIVAKKNGNSLMPTGVVDRLSEQEQLDLINFLSHLGKPGDFDASQGGVARQLAVFAGTHRVEQQGAHRITGGEVQEGWMPLVARVDGSVHKATLREMTQTPINISLVNVYLRTTVEAAKPGEVTLKVVGPEAAALWVDGERIDGQTTFTTTLQPGRHSVIVRLDARALPESLKLVSDDVAFVAEE